MYSCGRPQGVLIFCKNNRSKSMKMLSIIQKYRAKVLDSQQYIGSLFRPDIASTQTTAMKKVIPLDGSSSRPRGGV